MNNMINETAEFFGNSAVNIYNLAKLAGYKGEDEFLLSSNFASEILILAGKIKEAKKDNIDFPKMTDSTLIFEYLNRFNLNYLSEENFVVIYLNNQNQILGTKKIASGTYNACIIDCKIIFNYALNFKASKIILAHNHPSGILKPSLADLQLTEKVKKAADFLDIQLLDHLIIGGEFYYSFNDSKCL